MTSDLDIEIIVKSMVDYEGFEIGEAELIAPVRAELPASAFCGPDKTFPSYDLSVVRTSLRNLEKYGYKLSKLTKGIIKEKLEKKDFEMWMHWLDEVSGKNDI